MQAIKEKLQDMSAMRKAKAEAKETEKAEKELAKARVEVAHEVRMAREAEAAMDYHVNKAAEKAELHEKKLGLNHQQNPTSSEEAYHRQDAVDHASGAATGASDRTAGGPPSNNLL